MQGGDVKALVTGFDAFDGAGVNASQQAVLRLPARFGALEIATAILPTSYLRSLPALRAAIVRTQPEIVLCVGQADDRTVLCIERVAINIQDARIADNDGAEPHDRPVIEGAPTAYFTTLPARLAVASLCAAGLNAEISNSAGVFVCNHVFFGLMHCAASSAWRLRAGFLHVPRLPQPEGRGNLAPAMTADDMAHAITIVLEVAAARAA